MASPGSGKTFALRDLLLAASLDPRCEIRGYELKGVGDFAVLAPVMAEYGNGFDDDTLAACFAFIEWLYEECRRRSKRIEHYARLGKAPENKVTPELASLKGSGLHPLVAWFDELQELMTSKYGKDAGELLEKVIKLGRALGVIILIGTQIPDKDSLPTGITRNVNSRFCLSVADQTANDMILGTSAYKLGYRATVFQPVTEAGWGILAGFGKPVAGPLVLRRHHRRRPHHRPRSRPAHRRRHPAGPGRADPRHPADLRRAGRPGPHLAGRRGQGMERDPVRAAGRAAAGRLRRLGVDPADRGAEAAPRRSACRTSAGGSTASRSPDAASPAPT